MLRIPSSDLHVFEQVFMREEYDFATIRAPEVIIDAGANIGLASIYFASRFPACRIIALEPESENFRMLERNAAHYPNIVPVHGALWHEEGTIDLVDPGLGAWGFMTDGASGDVRGERKHSVAAYTVESLMRTHGLDRIDLLKVDIEGAEREVFSHAQGWIERVDALIVELHERMKSGCVRSFYNATNDFDAEWLQGENVFLARRNACMLWPEGSALFGR
jgi:FkbM family methyltransferase